MKKHLLNLFLFILTSSLCKAQGPTFLGMTCVGGYPGMGNIFQINGTGSGFKSDYSFHLQGYGPTGNVIQASDGLLYGMTSEAGQYGNLLFGGTIFSYNISTGIETDLHDFGKGFDGDYPQGSFIQASDGLLYGMTSEGGQDGKLFFGGTIFSYNISTGIESVLHNFSGDFDGNLPTGSLIQATNGLLYGMTYAGGVNNEGIIFSYNISTGVETHLLDFDDTDGASPNGSLIQGSNGLLYGMTTNGGINEGGIIFSYDISSNKETILYNFGEIYNNGWQPYGSLTEIGDSLFYGMTSSRGIYGNGTIFSYNISTGIQTVVHNFADSSDGKTPHGSLIFVNDSLLFGLTEFGGINYAGIILSYNISTGKEIVLHGFGSGLDGSYPNGSLVQATNGLLYGVTFGGGVNSLYGFCGTIFNYNISTNTETDIYDFNCGNDGANPVSNVIKAINGLIYGLTMEGGTEGWGTLFSYNMASDSETVLHDFDSETDGNYPNGSLIQANDGLLYGLTVAGGLNNYGSIFNYNISSGEENIVHNFGGGIDGVAPSGSLIQANNGLLYGMTQLGGAYVGVNNEGYGTIFSYDISTGTETVLYSFGDSTDGLYPYGSLIQADDGLLYGMTFKGGNNDSGIIFSFNISTGTETKLHDFGSGSDGDSPNGSLVQASNGLLYGMTETGGVYRAGTIFSYDIPSRIEKVLYNFGNGYDGAFPYGSLIQASDGLLYGMTFLGGDDSIGTIFNYDISTGVETVIHDFSGIDGLYPYGDLLEIDSTTGINLLATNNNQLTIYPNPTSGQLTIKTNNYQNGNSIEIYNMVGEKIYQSVLNNSQSIINLSDQPAGMYFVYLKSKENVGVGKVILTK